MVATGGNGDGESELGPPAVPPPSGPPPVPAAGSANTGADPPWAAGLLAIESARPAKRSRRQRRIDRWTRPTPRRDVRWAVGRFGQLLVVVGLLMFGFVAYQLWGTGIEYARAQDRADGAVADLMDEARQRASGATTPDVVASTPDVVASTSPGGVASTTPVVGPIDWPALIRPEEHFATLSIPKLERQDQIVEGVSRDALKEGPGHFPSTPLPGQLGNSAIAGHRTTFGGPFFHFDQLEIGDEIIVETPYGGPGNGPGRFVYLVTGVVIVAPNETEVLQTLDPETATLTLVTCHPVRTARQRMIVSAELDLAASDAPGPAVILDDLPPAELPGDEQTTTVTTELPGLATAGTATATPADSGIDGTAFGSTPATTATDFGLDTLAPATTAESATTVATGVGGVDSERGAPPDAFGDGWFEDRAAWPHVAGWAALTAAVVLAGYRLAKAARHGLVGFAVAVAPFAVALYFTYQNINRLLPAAL